MLTDNPFALLAAEVSPALMQAYVIAMVALVAAGTVFDVLHKRSGQYFFETRRAANIQGRKGGNAAIPILAAIGESLVSGEFCGVPRRIAHLLTMYGFLLYAVTTIILVFGYSMTPAPNVLPALWRLGALMVFLGCVWFWFFLRVDVASEGHARWRIVRADLFVLSLSASAGFALVWSSLEAWQSPASNAFLGLYLAATTLLFAAVPWSKFAHMFYKPAAAIERHIAESRGWRQGLPPPAERKGGFGGARRSPHHY